MPKDYVTILRTILKEYALTKSISSKWLFDLINIQTILTFQDLIDVMDELLEETTSNYGIHPGNETILEWKKLLIETRNTKIIFDLLLD